MLQYDEEIEKIFTSRNSTEYGYMAIIGKYKFSIYYVQDDGEGSADYNNVF